jgi:helicase MOV-10
VLRRQHQALDSALFDSALDNDRLFFPTVNHIVEGGSMGTVPRAAFYNALIGSNPRQTEAVNEIVTLTPGSVPFIVWGPWVSHHLYNFLDFAHRAYLFIDRAPGKP